MAVYAVRNRRTPGAWPMAAMMISAGVWSVGYALEISTVGVSEKVFWAKMQYLGICGVPFSAVAFGIVYSGRNLRNLVWMLLAVPSLATVFLVFTNGRHGLIWTSIGVSRENLFLVLEHGPAFWVYWVYSYILIVTGLVMITTVVLRSQRLYLMQSVILILGLLAPWLCNSLYVLEILPGNRGFDPTPLGFTVTGLLLAFGLFRYGLLDMVPVAHHRIVESMPDAVLVLDEQNRILDVNPSSSPLLLVPFDQAVGRKVGETVAGWENLGEELLDGTEVRIGDPPADYEVTRTILSGKSRGMRHSPDGLVLIFRDVGDKKAAERELRESETRYRRLVELSPDAIVVHSQGYIDYVNNAGLRIVGAAKTANLVGRSILEFVHPDYVTRMAERLRLASEVEGYASAAEEKFVRLNGSVIDVETAVMAVAQSDKSVAQIVFREITERKAAEERLAHQAYHDTLTGLPNRSFFTRRLGETLDGVSGTVGVLFLDLDGFKLINDSLGHEYGDGLLASVATRLKRCIRPEDTVARMGGDEFTVLLQNITDVSEAERVAQRIAAALDSPFEIGGHSVSVTASIGIAVSDAGERRATDILRDADVAMYEAKREGGTRYRIFREGMADLAIRNLEMKNGLRQALRRGEFVIHYQPKIRISDGEVCGVEALLRWEHPKRGLLYPADFIPVAEESGLMAEIGVHVLEEALREIADWLRRLPDSPSLTLGINFSPGQLGQPDIADEAISLIRRSGLAPNDLEFEITEDSFIEEDGPAVRNLLRLREAGVNLSVDDFGTGYSSLSRLKVVPVDTIKIDHSLISELDSPESDDATIVAGLIDLTHALGKSVVAEGVENEAQLSRLRDLGCDFAQGHFFYPPMTADRVLELLEERARTAKDGEVV